MFNQYFVNILRNHYADFDGRAKRADFWYFFLCCFLVGAAASILSLLIGSWFASLVSLALFIPNIAMTMRRLHDIGKSGWWILICFIPVIGFIWLLILMAKAGDRGANAYGEDPMV